MSGQGVTISLRLPNQSYQCSELSGGPRVATLPHSLALKILYSANLTYVLSFIHLTCFTSKAGGGLLFLKGCVQQMCRKSLFSLHVIKNISTSRKEILFRI